MAPPVPPRPVQQSYRPSYSSFPSSYSPYGSSLYGGYSPYSYGGAAAGYGGAGGYGLGGYNRFGHGGEDVPPSRFVQQAEESSRGAFQSIESIVQAFTSVSMMLDATFSAVYNSFRAVLDVANHMTRLRAHLTRVLSAFALVRTLRYLYRRLQRLLGRRSASEVEDLWADSAGEALAARSPAGADAAAGDQSVKSWPIFLFFAVVMGGPYLIWKLLSAGPGAADSATNWASGEDDHVVARAEFDFSAASDEEISLRAGDLINLAPKEHQPRVRGWLLASVDGQTSGLVPANYVKVLGKRRGRKHAEAERPVQVQVQVQQNRTEALQTGHSTHTQPGATTQGLGSASTADLLLESVYADTPAPPLSVGAAASNSSGTSSAQLNIPAKTDL